MGFWNLLFGPVDVNSIYEELKREDSKKKDKVNKSYYSSADSGYVPIAWSDPGCAPSDGGGFSGGGDTGCSGGDGGGACGH